MGSTALGECRIPISAERWGILLTNPVNFPPQNMGFSVAFSLAGKSPKSPGSENMPPERAIFG